VFKSRLAVSDVNIHGYFLQSDKIKVKIWTKEKKAQGIALLLTVFEKSVFLQI
jgi:hypothetical protein